MLHLRRFLSEAPWLLQAQRQAPRCSRMDGQFTRPNGARCRALIFEFSQVSLEAESNCRSDRARHGVMHPACVMITVVTRRRPPFSFASREPRPQGGPLGAARPHPSGIRFKRELTMPQFDPELVQLMRTVLEDAMTKVPLEISGVTTKGYLAQVILKAAAEGRGCHTLSADIHPRS
jgi:hypothetical protein